MNRNEFETYLKGLPGETVFPTCASTKCPVSQFLLSSTGQTWVVVAQDRHILLDTEDVFNPGWATEFIRRFDRLPGDSGTAAQALEILEGIDDSD